MYIEQFPGVCDKVLRWRLWGPQHLQGCEVLSREGWWFLCRAGHWGLGPLLLRGGYWQPLSRFLVPGWPWPSHLCQSWRGDPLCSAPIAWGGGRSPGSPSPAKGISVRLGSPPGAEHCQPGRWGDAELSPSSCLFGAVVLRFVALPHCWSFLIGLPSSLRAIWLGDRWLIVSGGMEAGVSYSAVLMMSETSDCFPKAHRLSSSRKVPFSLHL